MRYQHKFTSLDADAYTQHSNPKSQFKEPPVLRLASLHPCGLSESSTEPNKLICDRCEELIREESVWGCEQCGFDVCRSCLSDFRVPHSQHPHLLSVLTAKPSGTISCHKCQTSLPETSSIFRCTNGCPFHLCSECTLGRGSCPDRCGDPSNRLEQAYLTSYFTSALEIASTLAATLILLTRNLSQHMGEDASGKAVLGDNSRLSSLPPELLHNILSFLEPTELVLSAAPCCRTLYQAATSDDLWQPLFTSRYRQLLLTVFNAVCPEPEQDVCWRSFYFEFGFTWMSRARYLEKVIIRIDGQHYDVTDFLDDHPGDPALLLGSAGTDASEAFAEIGHTANARRILKRFLLRDLQLPVDSRLRIPPPESRWNLVLRSLSGSAAADTPDKPLSAQLLKTVFSALWQPGPMNLALWRLVAGRGASWRSMVD